MIVQEVEIKRAEGLRICEELIVNGNILPKNHKLTKEDITNLKAFDIKCVFVAKAENGDIDFDTALGMIAAKICGKNLGFRIDERGFAEIIATKDGVSDISLERINKFNRLSKYFVLNTITPLSVIKSKTVVAKLEILLPIISQNIVDEMIFALSGNETLLNLREIKEQNAAVLSTRLFNDSNEDEFANSTIDKIINEYKNFNLKIINEHQTIHCTENIIDKLDELVKSPVDIIFIISATRNYSDNDIIFSAIKNITDDIVCSHIPLFGGNDLIIAMKNNKKIICLPHNYLYMEASVIRHLIDLALIKEKLYSYDFNNIITPVIQGITRIKNLNNVIKDNNKSDKISSIAGIILAAGQSKRIDKNKLLVDVDGKPLAVKVIKSAISAKISPIFVITGYQAEKLESELENFDINVIYNPNYFEGVRTSINLGIKSVPDFCDGVMIIPADMPNISTELINKMVDKFDKNHDKQLVVANKRGIKSNPVIWSKSLYNVADLIAENADIRPVMIEHSDYTTAVKASETELLDVNFQNDLDMLLKQTKA